MKQIIDQLEVVAAGELSRANQEFPLFASKHEAVGVLEEEYREARFELDNYEQSFEMIKDSTFGDREPQHMLEVLLNARKDAIYAAAELVQNIAMIDKWIESESCWQKGGR